MLICGLLLKGEVAAGAGGGERRSSAVQVQGPSTLRESERFAAAAPVEAVFRRIYPPGAENPKGQVGGQAFNTA